MIRDRIQANGLKFFDNKHQSSAFLDVPPMAAHRSMSDKKRFGIWYYGYQYSAQNCLFDTVICATAPHEIILFSYNLHIGGSDHVGKTRRDWL